jgi:hypothetical protein
MDALLPELNRRFDPPKLIGYLNLSDGRPDAKWRRLLADAFAFLLDRDDATPWATVHSWLSTAADELSRNGSTAFRDVTQAEAVIAATFEFLPAAYRRYHADLLGGQPDAILFNAFFFAKGAEAILRERSRVGPAAPPDLAAASVPALCDYVGYRPVAQLETRQAADYFPKEKVCPVPLYLAGAGVAPGRYADLIRPALELLQQTDQSLLEEAGLDPALIEELSVDPRPVDHFHPVTKRPSSLFGEWDPHRIDGRGNYRRFVVRTVTLDALNKWVETGPASRMGERRFEAAAALAGTVLMGAGISGSGPAVYDSGTTLAGLVPRVARYRDGFYKRLLADVTGLHGDRLRAEAEKLKQPFAAVRQFLNAAIANERALHLQERRLGLFFATLGYPTAARERLARILTPATRIEGEIRIRQTEAVLAAKDGRLADAYSLLAEVEDFLRRGIDCGAVIDPWNVLGFQGLFPIFAGREDTVRDPRAEDLILTVGRQFDAYASALAAASTADEPGFRDRLSGRLAELASWWDAFATAAVSDLPKVYGGERAESAGHVARALGLWKQGGAADPAFWRNRLEGFRTPSAFAQVIDALLDHGDYRASMALLVTWLGEADTVPLQDPSASFVRLAFRWLRGTIVTGTLAPMEKGQLVRRFFELLEANAQDRWDVPRVGDAVVVREPGDDDTESDEIDLTDHSAGGLVEDEGPRQPGFPLASEADRMEERLRFLAAVARLWRTAATPDLWTAGDTLAGAALGDWFAAARRNRARLAEFLTEVEGIPVPDPTGGVEGVIEYDRRRVLKGNLLEVAAATAVETEAAARGLAALLSRSTELAGPAGRVVSADDAPGWDGLAVRVERAVLRGDAEAVRTLLPAFVALFRQEPLLVHPPSDGGPPGPAVRALVAQQIVESLLSRLPRLGLLRETFQLTKLAWAMERNHPPSGKRVSSFDQLFRTGVASVVDAILSAAKGKNATALATTDSTDDDRDGPLAPALRQVAESFHGLWLQHSQSLRLSALEPAIETEEWEQLAQFVRTYGRDLFTVRFLSLSNVRGILSQGVEAWLDRQADPDSEATPGGTGYGEAVEDRPKLVDDWADGDVNKPKAARLLETVLQSLVEHYDEYRDYNTTTTQSDYGHNLHILLDFLRLKVAYDRYAWRLRPMIIAHEVLCRRGFDALAGRWREFIASRTKKLAAELLDELAAREAEHGIRLRTVRDRLEERFLRPLEIDRAAARVAPAAAAARDGGSERNSAFRGLLDAVLPLAESPTGVGLDVPAWLRRLEDELRKIRADVPDPDADEREPDPLPPPAALDFDTLRKQLADWDKPLGEES